MFPHERHLWSTRVNKNKRNALIEGGMNEAPDGKNGRKKEEKEDGLRRDVREEKEGGEERTNNRIKVESEEEKEKINDQPGTRESKPSGEGRARQSQRLVVEEEREGGGKSRERQPGDGEEEAVEKGNRKEGGAEGNVGRQEVGRKPVHGGLTNHRDDEQRKGGKDEGEEKGGGRRGGGEEEDGGGKGSDGVHTAGDLESGGLLERKVSWLILDEEKREHRENVEGKYKLPRHAATSHSTQLEICKWGHITKLKYRS